jgi:hypothetical protein
MSESEGLSAEEQVLYERLGPLFEQERMRMAKALTAKRDHELLGQNEFEMRDRLHALGAQVLAAAANERQKKGRVRGC